MISVSQALALIEQNTPCLGEEITHLTEAYGKVLSKSVLSPINMPPFDQSAMDGYAVFSNNSDTYSLRGELKAGDSGSLSLTQGEAARVFTGAPIPANSDTVIIQEHVSQKEQSIFIQKMPIKGANIRATGEQVKEGDFVLNAGCLLNEAAIGFLAGLGITKISTYKKPTITILTTGNELQEPGTKLKPGCIYESNGLMLKTALRRLGIEHITICKVKDDFQATQNEIKKAVAETDVVLISGGISVGDYDFVKAALEKNEVQEVFYKVNQKPGKPLWFGKKENKRVFGLPGNPASSLTCFYVYVVPMLRIMMGYSHIHLAKLKAIVQVDIENGFGKTLFLKAIAANNQITPLTGQASSMLNTYAISNALLCVPEDKQQIEVGEEVSYLSLTF